MLGVLLPFDQLERAEPDLFEAIMVETHGVLWRDSTNDCVYYKFLF